MLKLRCIDKKYDSSNNIVGYVLWDENKNQYIITKDGAYGTIIPHVRTIKAFKAAISKGYIEVINLQLTSDGRLIDKKIEIEDKSEENTNKRFKQDISECIQRLENKIQGNCIKDTHSDLAKAIYYSCMYIFKKEGYRSNPYESITASILDRGNRGNYIRLDDFNFIKIGFNIETGGPNINIIFEVTSGSKYGKYASDIYYLSDMEVEYRDMSNKYMYCERYAERTFIDINPEGIVELIDHLNSNRSPYDYINAKRKMVEIESEHKKKTSSLFGKISHLFGI